MKFRITLTLCMAMASAMAADVPRRTLDLPPGAGNPRNSEGAFLHLTDGRTLFIYSKFYGKDGSDFGNADIVSRESTDNGETWSKQDNVVIKNDGQQNVMSVSTLRLADGRLALVHARKNSNLDCSPLFRVSEDDGKTWSEPVNTVAWAPGYYVINNDRLVQLRSGRLLLPLARHAFITDKDNDWNGTILCTISDDGGKTWRGSKDEFKIFREDGKTRITAQEPGLVELKDGRLMMFIRTNAGCQYICFSSDGGDTWSKPTASALKSPLSPASIKRLPNGDLLAVYNNHDGIPTTLADRRVPLSLAISKDDGATWQLHKTLEGRLAGWYCYIAIDVQEDAVLLGYCAEGLHLTRVTKVPYSWIYDETPRKPYAVSLGALQDVPNGPFTRLETAMGTWTAAEGSARVLTFARGKGVTINGGTDTQAELELPKSLILKNLKIGIERFTSRPPYALTIEANVDGKWVLVFAQGNDTPVSAILPVTWAAPELATDRLRFRCTSVLGATVCEQGTSINLFGFFND